MKTIRSETLEWFAPDTPPSVTDGRSDDLLLQLSDGSIDIGFFSEAGWHLSNREGGHEKIGDVEAWAEMPNGVFE